MVMEYLFSILGGIVALLSWFVIVVTGSLPRGLFDVQRMVQSYSSKAFAFITLLTETYPPVTDPA